MVQGGDLRTGEMQVVINHFEGGMSQDLFQAEDIAPIKQVIGSEGVTAKVGMQPFNARGFGEPGEHQLHGIDGYRSAGWRQEEIVAAGNRLRPHFVDVAE